MWAGSALCCKTAGIGIVRCAIPAKCDMDTLDILQALHDALKRLEQAVESRRLWYEMTAQELLKAPVTVAFKKRRDALGEARRMGKIFLIDIRPGLPLEIEHAVFCHELAHLMLNHVESFGPKAETKRKAFLAALESGELSKAMGFDCKEIAAKATYEFEGEANQIGRKLFQLLFPRETYRL